MKGSTINLCLPNITAQNERESYLSETITQLEREKSHYENNAATCAHLNGGNCKIFAHFLDPERRKKVEKPTHENIGVNT